MTENDGGEKTDRDHGVSSVPRGYPPRKLPLLVLWGLSPSLLIWAGMLGGYTPQFANLPAGNLGWLSVGGLLGGPIILGFWSAHYLRLTSPGSATTDRVGIGLGFTVSMYVANLILGIGGCNLCVAPLIPPSGLF